MSKKNRVFIGTIIAISLLLLLLIWPFRIFRFPGIALDPWEAIPANTSVVLRADSFLYHFQKIKKLEHWQTLGESPLLQSLDLEVNALRTLVKREEKLRKAFARTPVLVSLHVLGANETTYGFVLDDRNCGFTMQDMIAAGGRNRTLKYQYKGYTIYQVNLGSGESFVMAGYANLVLLAHHTIVLEDMINTLRSPNSSVNRDKAFRSIKKTPRSQMIQVFVQWPVLLEQTGMVLQPYWKGLLAEGKSWGKWFTINVQVDANAVSCKGVWAGGDAGPSAPEQPWEGERKLPAVLPGQMQSVLWIGEKGRGMLKRLAGFTLNEGFGELIANEVQDELAWVDMGINAGKSAYPYSVAILVKEPENLEKKIKQYISKHKAGRFESYQTKPFFYLYEASLIAPLLGQEYPGPLYGTIVQGAMVWSFSRQSITDWIDQVILNQTLANDVDYQLWLKKMPAKAQCYQYIVPDQFRANQLVRQASVQDMGGWLEPILQGFQFGGMAWEGSGVQNIALHFGKSKVKDQAVAALWRAELPAAAITAPMIVNASESRSKLVLVQDADFTLHCLDAVGQPLWQFELQEPLLSTIHEVDYFGNERSLLVFNTATGLYTLDQQGKLLTGFPIRFASNATNGMIVAKFESNKEYVYFVACANDNVYGFRKNGQPLSGWNIRADMGRIRFPLIHAVSSDKDYLLALNTEGEYFVMKQSGEYRFEPGKLPGLPLSGPAAEDPKHKVRMVMVTQAGEAIIMNGEGATFKLKVPVGQNKNVRFAYGDVIGDDRAEFIVQEANQLAIYGYQKEEFKLVQKKQLDMGVDTVFLVAHPGFEKQKIGLVSKARQQVWLLNADGSLLPPFPLAGNSSFVITRLARKEPPALVAVHHNEVYAARLVTPD